jgi:hypothetical protein
MAGLGGLWPGNGAEVRQFLAKALGKMFINALIKLKRSNQFLVSFDFSGHTNQNESNINNIPNRILLGKSGLPPQ